MNQHFNVIPPPSKKKLKKMVWKYRLQEVADHFEVSRGTIVKWCDDYNIKRPVRGYWQKKAAQEGFESRHDLTFERHTFKGRTKHICPRGYVLVHYPDHPAALGRDYISLHRLKMENKLGRYLNSTELVHHKDTNRQNNHLSNLELTSRKKHTEHHSEERRRRKRPPKKKLERLVWSYPIDEISKRLHVAHRTIDAWCDHYNLDRPSSGYWASIEPPPKEELASLVLCKTQKEIAEYYGVGTIMVRKWRKILRIDLPSKEELTELTKRPSKKKLKKLLYRFPKNEILKKYKIGRSTLNKWIEDYYLESPPRGYFNRWNKG